MEGILAPSERAAERVPQEADVVAGGVARWPVVPGEAPALAREGQQHPPGEAGLWGFAASIDHPEVDEADGLLLLAELNLGVLVVGHSDPQAIPRDLAG